MAGAWIVSSLVARESVRSGCAAGAVEVKSVIVQACSLISKGRVAGSPAQRVGWMR